MFALLLALLSPAWACTVTISHSDDGVVVGNNEDWFRTDAKLWHEPAGKAGPYGAVLFGFEGGGKFAQGGMNDQGLFFDGLGIPRVELARETRQGKRAAPVTLFRDVLHQSATVDEALAQMAPYFIPYIRGAQMVLVDRHGEVAVFNVNGVTLRTRVAPGDFRVISNAPVEADWSATEAIAGVPQACDALTADPGVAGTKAALMATHQEGPRVHSAYSTVFSLGSASMTTYYLYDYDRPWTVSLADPPAGVVRFDTDFGGE